MDLEEFDPNDMMDADTVSSDKDTWEELRQLAAENMVWHKESQLPETDVILTKSHEVGVEDAEELSEIQDRAIAAINTLAHFFHVRPQDVPETFLTPQEFADRRRMKVQGPSRDADGNVRGGVMASDETVDEMKEMFERFQRCPDCGEWCAIAKLEKRELQEEDEPVPFSCDSCGNEFTLEEVKE